MKSKVTYTKAVAALFAFVLPFMMSCSVIGGNNYSDDPAVRAQQERVELLESEYRDAKRLAEEAEQREKAAKNRLEAAEHELKALKSQAKGS